MVSYLANLINYAFQNYDSVFVYVVGRIGAGKTSFALHLAYELLGDWNKVLNYVFFDVEEFMKKSYTYIRRNERMKIAIIDDAGTCLNALRYREEKMMKIAELLNLSRSFLSGIVFTTPDLYDVLKRIRVKAMFSVQVKPLNKYKALASIYQTNYSVAYDRYYRKFIQEIEYPRHYPIFEQYKKMRQKYIINRIREIVGRKRKNKIKEYVLNKTTCPKCGKEGKISLWVSHNNIYVYIIHRKKGERCYIAELSKIKHNINCTLLINEIPNLIKK